MRDRGEGDTGGHLATGDGELQRAASEFQGRIKESTCRRPWRITTPTSLRQNLRQKQRRPRSQQRMHRKIPMRIAMTVQQKRKVEGRGIEPSTWRCDGVAARPGDRATHGAAGREGGVALREGRRRHACAGCCHGSRGSDQSACRTTSSANHYTYVFMWSHAQQNRGTELTWVSRQRAALLLASRCE